MSNSKNEVVHSLFFTNRVWVFLFSWFDIRSEVVEATSSWVYEDCLLKICS